MTDISRLVPALADRYRIERELGQGGMATVYLAQDLKHDRKVAIKVLRPELAAVIGADRFLTEIKTTANLQHPHILPLHDSGQADSFLFYVMPFVEGESLRDRLNREKQLPIPDAVRIATEVAGALDYAHRHGVIHRDIKPENILLHDGRALVADFGIALAATSAGSRMTETGMSLGTPHYMSPEQAMGDRELTPRSDVYALGAMTYEMLLGEPPFTGPTAQSIVAKVMTEKPAGLIARRERIPPQVEDAVLTALEKLPADRFATAAEFAGALAGDARTPRRKATRTDTRPWFSDPRTWVLTGIAAVALAAVSFAWRVGPSRGPGVTFTQKTFRSEAIYNARLAPDGQTIVFSSTGREGTIPHLFVIRPDNAESEPMGPDSTHLLAISSTGQLAVLTGARFVAQRLFEGTLATLPLGGGAPREVLAGVREADFSPDGASLAITRTLGGEDRLEYPIGTVLFRSAGYLSDLRVSPAGDEVAFFEHPAHWDDRGEVVVIDRTGKTLTRSKTYWGMEGLDWRGDGKKVLFSATAATGSYGTLTVFAMDRQGRAETVLSSAGGLTLQDASPTGRWLATADQQRMQIRLHEPSSKLEQDVGWLDASSNPVISADGKLMALGDQSVTGGLTYTVLLRKTAGSPAARLGEGQPLAFSPDARWLLVSVPSTPPKVMLYPTGPGEPKRLDQGQFESLSYGSGSFFADGQRYFVCGSLKQQRARCFAAPLSGGPLTPVSSEGTLQAVLSPDNAHVVAQVGDSFQVFSVSGGPPQPARGLTPGDVLSRWSPDGRELWVFAGGRVRAFGPPGPGDVESGMRVDRVDPNTGRRSLLTEVIPDDRAGLRQGNFLQLADDPRVYVYRQTRYLSSLFMVEGVR